MDPENETHPLLHDFENETWRSRTRKRCIRIPSEAAITGLILGVFFVVVTLLIVLENMEKTKKDDISIDKKLLASPGFNQKLADKSWKDEKLRKLDKINNDWKILTDLSDSPKYNKKQKDKSWQDEKQRKFDKVNKGWKILPNVTERRDPKLQMRMTEDMNEIVNVLQSPMIKREKINEEWKKLTEAGWKDYEIRRALLQVLIERKNELNGTGDENVQRSPTNLDELWNKINKSWQEKVEQERAEREYRRLIHSKGVKDQKNINDAWKDKMTVLQSPKATAKKDAKADEGWENLSGQGWKNKDIEKALFNAWKEKENEKNVLLSPMNVQSLLEKASDFIKNVIQKKENKKTDQDDGGAKNYMLSPKNFEALKSVMETSKKYKKDYKKKSYSTEKPEDDSSLHLDLKDFIDFIMEKIKKQQKDKMDEDTDRANNGSMNVIQYSNSYMDDFIQNLITEAIKDHNKVNKDMMEKQIAINDAWKNKMNNLDTTETSDGKRKIINNDWQTLNDKVNKDMMEKQIAINDAWKNKMNNLETTETSDGKRKTINNNWKTLNDKVNKDMMEKQKSINDAWKNKMTNSDTTKTSDGKWKTINDHWKTLIEHERNSFFGKNDGSKPSTTDSGEQKILMSSGKMKFKNVDNGYKKLSTNGWSDKDIKDAINKASRDELQILKAALGFDNMKWKKVNEGYKKTYNKS